MHYAVNCASIGCPMLREEAYVAARLEEQLEEQARRFLSDRSRNRCATAAWRCRRSSTGTRRTSSRASSISRATPASSACRPGASPRLVFLDYDWTLNDSRSSSPR